MSELESDQQFEERRLRFYARHFVALDAQIYLPSARAETERVFSISGFVISVRDEWFLISAGHVFNDIEEAHSQGQVIENWSLDCSFSADANDSFSTPFGFQAAEKLHFYDPETGLDYAFVHLRQIYRLNLETNGVTALTEQGWRQNLPTDFDEYFLLGIPTESIEFDPDLPYITKNMVIAPLEKLGEVPGGIPPKEGLFFARLGGVHEGTVNVPRSIVGMSGGPIFGQKRVGDRTKYWVVAIQSWWDENSRIIRACYLRVLCEWLEMQLESTSEE